MRERGIVFHTDAVQTVGKIPIDHGRFRHRHAVHLRAQVARAQGIGVLYVRKGTSRPLSRSAAIRSGGAGRDREHRVDHRHGRAAQLVMEYMEDENTRVRALRDKLETELLKRVPNSMINGDPENRLPNTTSIAFEFVEGEAILLLMDQYGICASSGSACTSGSLEPSHVLRAMGVPFTAAHGSIRYSLSIYNTEEEIDFVIDKMPPIIERLRQTSSFLATGRESLLTAGSAVNDARP